jgi:hypothetical protein
MLLQFHICCYWPDNPGLPCLRLYTVCKYPDQQYYLWIHIKEHQAHLQCITAHTALDNTDVTNAVKEYLQVCYRHIGNLTENSVSDLISHADVGPL